MSVRPRVAVADTGTGNLRSVEKALATAGADVTVTSDADVIARADKVVVPGQGAFGGCMAGLGRGGGALEQAVRGAIAAGKPYLGICLGLQVLFEGSEEDPTCRGLGIFPGRVRRFAPTPGLKIPHMGWNGAERGPAAGTPVLNAIPDGTFFYFVHSYYPDPARRRGRGARHRIRRALLLRDRARQRLRLPVSPGEKPDRRPGAAPFIRRGATDS